MINTNIAWTTTALKMHIQSRHIWIFLQFCWQKIYPEFKLENNKVQKTIPTNNVSQKNSNMYIKKWQTAVVIQFSGTKQYQELQDCFSQKLTLYVLNKIILCTQMTQTIHLNKQWTFWGQGNMTFFIYSLPFQGIEKN